jgi:hypothetical protein
MGNGSVSYASQAEYIDKLKLDMMEGDIVLKKDETAAIQGYK